MDEGGVALHPKKGCKNRVTFVFEDESGYSERPTVRRTWAPKGHTPIIRSTGSWKNRTAIGMLACDARGKKPRLLLRILRSSARSPDFVTTLKHLRRHVRGKVFLLWDGLGGHWSKEVRAHIRANRSWLTVFRFPAYAPELNPAEGIWSASKSKDSANFCPKDVAELEEQMKKSRARIQRHPDVMSGCLKESGLFDC